MKKKIPFLELETSMFTDRSTVDMGSTSPPKSALPGPSLEEQILAPLREGRKQNKDFFGLKFLLLALFAMG